MVDNDAPPLAKLSLRFVYYTGFVPYTNGAKVQIFFNRKRCSETSSFGGLRECVHGIDKTYIPLGDIKLFMTLFYLMAYLFVGHFLNS